MKKFIVIYHAPADAFQQTENQSKEEMKKGMEQWMIWAKNCGPHLVDLGNPLGGGLRLAPGGKSESSQREVCGYSVLEAGSMDEAVKLLQGHPHLLWRQDCEIEVHEALPTPGE